MCERGSGDYSLFRPDGVLAFDARYMLQEDDGTLIMLYNSRLGARGRDDPAAPGRRAAGDPARR